MSDQPDKDSKSELPSEKKIQDTLEKGNVPFSRELTNTTSLFAILLIGYFYIPAFANDLTGLLRAMFANINDWPMDNSEDAMNIGRVVGGKLLFSMAPIILPLVFFGLVSSLSQNQPRFVLTRLQPKLERVSLPKGLKRLLGWHGVREFLKSLFKFTAAGMVALIVCLSQAEWILSQTLVEPSRIPGSIFSLFIMISLGLALSMTILGVVDLIWVRREWYNDLKMTHQEVKDERKQSEGDPMVKMRVHSVARDRARRRMIDDVENATMVIANPTHFAVALRFVPETDRAPVVLAKGQDLIALKIRERAEAHDVPVIEDPPLARSLYKAARMDAEIPVEFYVPIAKIVRILSDGSRPN